MDNDENGTPSAPEETEAVNPPVETGEEPTQDATAQPAEAEAEPVEGTDPAPKTFTQDELDAILEKRLARERRAWERQTQQPNVQPVSDGFDAEGNPLTPEQIIQQYEASRQQDSIREAYSEREEAALEKYPDFQQIAYNPNLPITNDMALAIQASDQGPDVLYWLGSNPKEAARLSKLPAFQQAKEIGRIEERLTTNPPAKKTTSAPPPISPIAAPSGGPKFDTTDPRSIQQMDTSAWIEAERARQRKKLEAKYNAR